ncbi:thioredoxin family protein, partial [Salinimicrobium oceani]
MKNILFGILFFVAGIASAQSWHNDLSSAQEQALKENKKILLIFQGSDWCAPCIKLDREIWSSSEFQDYAKDHYVLVKADFPRKEKNQLEPSRQEKNNKLAERYNPQGYFPLVVIMDQNGKVLGKTGY